LSTLSYNKNAQNGRFIITGGVARFYGERHTTKYRDYQGIFVVSAPTHPDYSIIGCITLPKSAISRKIQQYK